MFYSYIYIWKHQVLFKSTYDFNAQVTKAQTWKKPCEHQLLGSTGAHHRAATTPWLVEAFIHSLIR
eukprot:6206112-Lingulodinium_polyedra.AAC.1